jgi:hypothetical protein
MEFNLLPAPADSLALLALGVVFSFINSAETASQAAD